jgi:hypothetical protein
MLGLFLILSGCLLLQDQFFIKRALFEVNAAIKQESPFIWNMEQEGELLGLERYGFGELRFEDSQLKAHSLNRDPYFWLNLKGRMIDAKVYDTVQIRFYSDQKTNMQFHSHALGDGKTVYGTFQIGVKPGWQTITLKLDQRKWQVFPESKNAKLPSVRQWGGKEQIVTAVRIDPVVDADIDFAIDWVKFLSGKSVGQLPQSQAELLPETVVELDLLNQSWPEIAPRIAELRGKPVIIADSSHWRLPLSTLWLREEIQKLAPQAIFFPRPVELSRVLKLADTANEDITNPLTGWRLVISLVSLVALACAILLVVFIKKVSLKLSASVELALILIFSFLLWSLSAQSLDALFIINAIGFVFVSGFLMSTREGKWFAVLGLVRPAKVEVWVSALLTLAVAALMLFLSFYYGQLATTDWSKLLQGFIIYPFWGIVQQVYLGPVITGLLLAIVGRNSEQSSLVTLGVAMVAGFLFSLVHAPNSALMMATFLMGSCWSYLYQRFGSIIPLAISHGLLGSLFRELAPLQLQMNGSVGLVHFDWLWF